MFLDEITKKYPEIEKMRDEILLSGESVQTLIKRIIDTIDDQNSHHIAILQNENKILRADVEKYKKKFEYRELQFPLDLKEDSLSSFQSGSQVNMPDSQMCESQIFQSQTKISESHIFREERNTKMFDSHFDYDIREIEKKILNSLNDKLFQKLGHNHEDISHVNDKSSCHLINNVESHGIFEKSDINGTISYNLDKDRTVLLRNSMDEKKTASNSSINISSKLNIDLFSNSAISDSSADQINFLELNQKLYDLKQENARLSKELNYILSSTKKTNVDLYIKNYYEIVDLLRDKLDENVRLKNSSFLMSMKLQNIESCIVSFIKNTLIRIIKETLNIYKNNLVFFFTENQKLEIQASNLKMIEDAYQNAQNEIIVCRQIKKENERLEKELKTISIKNTLINSLEKRINAKNTDITVLEARNKLYSEEISRLLALLTEKERVISNMVIEEPIKNRILELENLKKDMENNKTKQKQIDKHKLNVLHNLKFFYEDLKSKINEKMMTINDIILFYKRKKDNQVENLEKAHQTEISTMKEKNEQLSVLLNNHRDQASQKDKQIANLNNELQFLKTENVTISNKINKISQENVILGTQNETLTAKLEQLKKDGLSPDLHSLIELERKEIDEQLQFYKNKCEEYESDQYTDLRTIKEQNEELNEENNDLASQNKDLKNLNDKLEKYSQEISQDHQKIQTNYSTLITKYKALESQYNSLKNDTKEKLTQLAEIQTLQDDTETQLDLARQKYSDLFEKYEQTANELDKMTDKYDSLNKQSSNKAYPSSDKKTTEILQDQEKRIENLKSVIIKLKAVNQKLVDRVKLQGSS